jgi:hypothetical protein
VEAAEGWVKAKARSLRRAYQLKQKSRKKMVGTLRFASPTN